MGLLLDARGNALPPSDEEAQAKIADAQVIFGEIMEKLQNRDITDCLQVGINLLGVYMANGPPEAFAARFNNTMQGLQQIANKIAQDIDLTMKVRQGLAAANQQGAPS
jgi:hypothetical protein